MSDEKRIRDVHIRIIVDILKRAGMEDEVYIHHRPEGTSITVNGWDLTDYLLAVYDAQETVIDEAYQRCIKAEATMQQMRCCYNCDHQQEAKRCKECWNFDKWELRK